MKVKLKQAGLFPIAVSKRDDIDISKELSIKEERERYSGISEGVVTHERIRQFDYVMTFQRCLGRARRIFRSEASNDQSNGSGGR